MGPLGEGFCPALFFLVKEQWWIFPISNGFFLEKKCECFPFPRDVFVKQWWIFPISDGNS